MLCCVAWRMNGAVKSDLTMGPKSFWSRISNFRKNKTLKIKMFCIFSNLVKIKKPCEYI